MLEENVIIREEINTNKLGPPGPSITLKEQVTFSGKLGHIFG